MAETVITVSRWIKGLDETEDPHVFNGPSPGGVAAELGMTRQAVHKAIARGDLEAWRVVKDGSHRLHAIVIKPASLEKFKAMRRLKDTG